MRRIASNRQWLFLAASAVLCVAVLVAIHRMPATRLASDPAVAALLNERERLRACDDATRDELRHQRQAQTHDTWTPEKLGALHAKLGPAWQWTVPEPVNQAVVARTSLRLRDWPALLVAVRQLEVEPDLRIEGVEIATESANSAARVRVVIELRLIGGA